MRCYSEVVACQCCLSHRPFLIFRTLNNTLVLYITNIFGECNCHCYRRITCDIFKFLKYNLAFSVIIKISEEAPRLWRRMCIFYGHFNSRMFFTRWIFLRLDHVLLKRLRQYNFMDVGVLSGPLSVSQSILTSMSTLSSTTLKLQASAFHRSTHNLLRSRF